MKHYPDELQRASDAARLYGAAQAIRAYGWVRGGGPGDGLCLLQALAIADGFDKTEWNEYGSRCARPIPAALTREALLRVRDAAGDVGMRCAIAIAQSHIMDATAVYVFNDNLCAGAEDAIELLDTAARKTLQPDTGDEQAPEAALALALGEKTIPVMPGMAVKFEPAGKSPTAVCDAMTLAMQKAARAVNELKKIVHGRRHQAKELMVT